MAQQNTRMQGQFHVLAPLDIAKPKTVAQLPALWATPGLGGVYFAMHWTNLQTGPNTYDLSFYLPLLRLLPAGMAIVIGIIGGITIPSFLLDVNGGPITTITEALEVVLGQPLVSTPLPTYDATYWGPCKAVWGWLIPALLALGYNVVGAKASSFCCTRDEEFAVQAFSQLGPNLVRYDTRWAAETTWRPRSFIALWLDCVDYVFNTLLPTGVASFSTEGFSTTNSGVSLGQGTPWIDDNGNVLTATTSNTCAVITSMIQQANAIIPGRIGVCPTGLGQNVDPFSLSLITNGVQLHFQMQTSSGVTANLATAEGFVEAEDEGLAYGSYYLEIHTPELEACQAQVTSQAPLYAALAALQNAVAEIFTIGSIIFSIGGIIPTVGATATENDLLDNAGNVLQDTAGNNLLWG